MEAVLPQLAKFQVPSVPSLWLSQFITTSPVPVQALGSLYYFSLGTLMPPHS